MVSASSDSPTHSEMVSTPPVIHQRFLKRCHPAAVFENSCFRKKVKAQRRLKRSTRLLCSLNRSQGDKKASASLGKRKHQPNYVAISYFTREGEGGELLFFSLSRTWNISRTWFFSLIFIFFKILIFLELDIFFQN